MICAPLYMALFDSLDDFLLANITQFLPSPTNAHLRATCRRFARAIAPPAKTTNDRIWREGCEQGNCILCEFAAMTFINSGTNLLILAYKLINKAARYNHSNLFTLAREWIYQCSVEEYCPYMMNDHGLYYFTMMNKAAKHGRTEMFEIARKWLINEIPAIEHLLGTYDSFCAANIRIKTRWDIFRNRNHIRDNYADLIFRCKGQHKVQFEPRNDDCEYQSDREYAW